MGLLTDPGFMVGLGLLAQGPSRNPINPWQGVQNGLLMSQRAQEEELQRQQLAQIAQYRQAQIDQMQRAADQDKKKQEQIEQALASVPPEMVPLFRARPDLISEWAKNNMSPPKRETMEDVNGVPRYMDTREPVFPDVTKSPETISPYQKEQLNISRERLAIDRADKERIAASAAEKAEQEKAQMQEGKIAKVEQNRLAIRAVDRAIKTIDENYFASGKASLLSPDWMPGTSEKQLKGELSTIKSAIGLERLLDVKRQGGTFGALNASELDLLISSLGSLDQGLPSEELKASLSRIKLLLAKANIKVLGTDNDVFSQADKIIGGQ